LPAAMTIEQVLARMHPEGRFAFRVQGTKSAYLSSAGFSASFPVMGL
jgi:hypothetical protein